MATERTSFLTKSADEVPEVEGKQLLDSALTQDLGVWSRNHPYDSNRLMKYLSGGPQQGSTMATFGMGAIGAGGLGLLAYHLYRLNQEQQKKTEPKLAMTLPQLIVAAGDRAGDIASGVGTAASKGLDYASSAAGAATGRGSWYQNPGVTVPLSLGAAALVAGGLMAKKKMDAEYADDEADTSIDARVRRAQAEYSKLLDRERQSHKKASSGFDLYEFVDRLERVLDDGEKRASFPEAMLYPYMILSALAGAYGGYRLDQRLNPEVIKGEAEKEAQRRSKKLSPPPIYLTSVDPGENPDKLSRGLSSDRALVVPIGAKQASEELGKYIAHMSSLDLARAFIKGADVHGLLDGPMRKRAVELGWVSDIRFEKQAAGEYTPGYGYGGEVIQNAIDSKLLNPAQLAEAQRAQELYQGRGMLPFAMQNFAQTNPQHVAYHGYLDRTARNLRYDPATNNYKFTPEALTEFGKSPAAQAAVSGKGGLEGTFKSVMDATTGGGPASQIYGPIPLLTGANQGQIDQFIEGKQAEIQTIQANPNLQEADKQAQIRKLQVNIAKVQDTTNMAKFNALKELHDTGKASPAQEEQFKALGKNYDQRAMNVAGAKGTGGQIMAMLGNMHPAQLMGLLAAIGGFATDHPLIGMVGVLATLFGGMLAQKMGWDTSLGETWKGVQNLMQGKPFNDQQQAPAAPQTTPAAAAATGAPAAATAPAAPAPAPAPQAPAVTNPDLPVTDPFRGPNETSVPKALDPKSESNLAQLTLNRSTGQQPTAGRAVVGDENGDESTPGISGQGLYAVQTRLSEKYPQMFRGVTDEDRLKYKPGEPPRGDNVGHKTWEQPKPEVAPPEAKQTTGQPVQPPPASPQTGPNSGMFDWIGSQASKMFTPAPTQPPVQLPAAPEQHAQLPVKHPIVPGSGPVRGLV